MSGRLSEKAAIITGAARGIGYATARLFTREGARVGLIDRDVAGLEESAKQLAIEFPGAAIHWRQADIAEHRTIAPAFDMLAAALGRLDILVNNAAARAFGPVAD